MGLRFPTTDPYQTPCNQILRVNRDSSLVSCGKVEIGAGGCKKMLRNAQRPASTSLVPNGAVFNSSTRPVAAPCSTRDVTLAGVPFASEPVDKL